MAVITPLGAADISRLLESYSVGTLDGYKEASEGIENTNYFVRTSQEEGRRAEYVLTLIEEANGTHANLSALIKILDQCNAEGLPVPEIMRTVDGNAHAKLLDKPALLCTKLDGAHVANPVRSQCAAIGRFLARFHQATATLSSVIEPYVRDQTWLTEKAATVKYDIALLDRVALEESLTTVTQLLARSDVRQLPQAVIHADLFLDNALFNAYGLSGILDFHHAGYGYCIYDLAVAMNDWCRDREGLDRVRVVELLRGYGSIRPLTQAELWFLPTFLLYAALSFWLSRLLISVRNDLPANYPVKDPDEFKQLIRAHTKTPLMVVQESLL